MRSDLTRRGFLGRASVGASALGWAAASSSASARTSDEPALLGGSPVRTKPFPSWPVIEQNDETAWMEVLRGKRWNRLDGDLAQQFEASWAQMTGSKHALATSSGTTALFTALNALGVGPGDEVIVPPYTFVATINVVLLQYALPVFVDTDPETFQIDARKIESAITERTRCLLPVHIGGSAADLDTILAIGQKHNIPVLEDACQAHLGEWRGRKLGTLGDLGCFSFQASKNLNSGEGGSVLTQRDDLIDTCRSFHDNGRNYSGRGGATWVRNGCNLRLTEFQAALLQQQLTRLEEQTRRRDDNGAYLTQLLEEIPGIARAATYEGCTRNAYHLYMMRYDKAHFADLPRSVFLRALNAEGIPASGGYTPLNQQPFLSETFQSRPYQTIYSSQQLSDLQERNNHLPENDRICEEAVWFTQTTLLGDREDMDQIAEAIRKIQKHAARLARS